MDNDYKPHILEWTDKKVARFWNFYNSYKPYDGTWFTETVGSAILKLVNKKFKIKGDVLDYGTGKGFLLQHLLNNGSHIDLYACDFSDSIVRETNTKFATDKRFKGSMHITGLPCAYEANFFDFVFLIETIEHLTDGYLNSTLQEIYRILKPGGIIIITTPNDEMIEKHFVHCADCGATFHHMQHVRSWNVEKLSLITKKFNFESQICMAVDLMWYQKNGLLYYTIYKVKRLFGKSYAPHLVYAGKKK